MTSDGPMGRARELLDTYIDQTIDGFLSNADALVADPTDAAAGERLRDHIVDLDRLISLRDGLARADTG